MEGNPFHCPACAQQRHQADHRSGGLLPEPVASEIQRRYPGWHPGLPVCRFCVGEGKADYLESLLVAETGSLGALDQAVLDSLGADGLVAPGLEEKQEDEMLAWQYKLSRRIAVLASLAALESPLILDSQSLQWENDRLRFQNDYRLNLKAELEIRYLFKKRTSFCSGRMRS